MRTLILASSLLLLGACGKEGATSSEDSDTINTTDGPTDPTGTMSSSGTDGATSERPTTSGATGTDATSTDGTDTDATSTEGTSAGETESSSGPGTITNMTTNMTSDTSASDSSTGDTGGPAVPATAEDACAPNDGPAVEFKFDVVEAVCGAGWAGEQLRVVLFQGAPLAPGSHTLANLNGFASLQVGMGASVDASEGEVVIESWDGESVTGTYALTFMDDSMRAGSFTAVFCDTNPPCG